MTIREFTDLELFEMFNVTTRIEGDGEDWKVNQYAEDALLFHFIPVQRSGRLVDFEAGTPEKLQAERVQERMARAELLAAKVEALGLTAKEMGDDDFESDIDICSLIPAPLLI